MNTIKKTTKVSRTIRIDKNAKAIIDNLISRNNAKRDETPLKEILEKLKTEIDIIESSKLFGHSLSLIVNATTGSVIDEAVHETKNTTYSEWVEEYEVFASNTTKETVTPAIEILEDTMSVILKYKEQLKEILNLKTSITIGMVVGIIAQRHQLDSRVR